MVPVALCDKALHGPTRRRLSLFPSYLATTSKRGPTCEVFVRVLHWLLGKNFHPPFLHSNNLWDRYWNFNHTQTRTHRDTHVPSLCLRGDLEVSMSRFSDFHTEVIPLAFKHVIKRCWIQFKDKPYRLFYYKRCVSCSVVRKLTVACWCCLTCSSRFLQTASALIKVPFPCNNPNLNVRCSPQRWHMCCPVFIVPVRLQF